MKYHRSLVEPVVPLAGSLTVTASAPGRISGKVAVGMTVAVIVGVIVGALVGARVDVAVNVGGGVSVGGIGVFVDTVARVAVGVPALQAVTANTSKMETSAGRTFFVYIFLLWVVKPIVESGNLKRVFLLGGNSFFEYLHGSKPQLPKLG